MSTDNDSIEQEKKSIFLKGFSSDKSSNVKRKIADHAVLDPDHDSEALEEIVPSRLPTECTSIALAGTTGLSRMRETYTSSARWDEMLTEMHLSKDLKRARGIRNACGTVQFSFQPPGGIGCGAFNLVRGWVYVPTNNADPIIRRYQSP
uniref:Uncharacterized protein n=1 Tax=Vespula pensylvanica TaxID=30213 RepID=A0A834PG63_VESPE|nr:hypothetical protein H0235_001568 [Vespula pensylvanica]